MFLDENNEEDYGDIADNNNEKCINKEYYKDSKILIIYDDIELYKKYVSIEYGENITKLVQKENNEPSNFLKNKNAIILAFDEMIREGSKYEGNHNLVSIQQTKNILNYLITEQCYTSNVNSDILKEFIRVVNLTKPEFNLQYYYDHYQEDYYQEDYDQYDQEDYDQYDQDDYDEYDQEDYDRYDQEDYDQYDQEDYDHPDSEYITELAKYDRENIGYLINIDYKKNIKNAENYINTYNKAYFDQFESNNNSFNYCLFH